MGPRGHGGRRGGRRGNVRAAVLSLLAEEPRHGYAIMTELAERSGGLWRPSPGSVYPVLQQLQDEGLVSAESGEGRRVFSLTDEGRTYVQQHAEEMHEPWQVAETGPRRRVQSIMFAVQALGAAADQVARLADDVQAERAVSVIDTARKSLYRILADEAE
jgi:DNA-binding PadR family transcriptional regulator